jgi:hypothetical protein
MNRTPPHIQDEAIPGILKAIDYHNPTEPSIHVSGAVAKTCKCLSIISLSRLAIVAGWDLHHHHELQYHQHFDNLLVLDL